MQVAIVTHPTNGVGLERDFGVLRAVIESAGHKVTAVHHRRPKPRARFDLVIFAETYVPGWEDLAPVRWAIPNPEWWFWNGAVPLFDRILCKTRDTERIFLGLGGNAIYTGFEAASRLDPHVVRERVFLHVAGESRTKGTEAVIGAWEQLAIPHPLHVVTRRRFRVGSRKIRLHGWVKDGFLRALQNRCMFHLQPSEYEGFGHVVWEGLSTGAVVAVPDAAPLNEIGAAVRIPVATTGSMQVATTARVAPDGIRNVVERMLALSDGEAAQIGAAGRAEYEAAVNNFRHVLLEMLL